MFCDEDEVRDLEADYTEQEEKNVKLKIIIEDLKKINDDSVSYLQAISIEEQANIKLEEKLKIAVDTLEEYKCCVGKTGN